jgi:hypothetical protein
MAPALNLAALRRFAGNDDRPAATVSPRDVAAIVRRIEAGDAAMAELAKMKAAS